jgi:kynurenine formamidase
MLATERVTAGRGDILIVRTGHLAMCRDRKEWEHIAGGDAPGLSFYTADWVHARELAGVATDTWGMKSVE